VPEETNEWRELSADDVFTTFSARLASEAPPSAHATAGGRDDDHEDDHDMARALCEFAQRHATRQGYGGWKHAYLRFDHRTRTHHRTRTRTTAHAPPHTHTHTPQIVIGGVVQDAQDGGDVDEAFGRGAAGCRLARIRRPLHHRQLDPRREAGGVQALGASVEEDLVSPCGTAFTL